MSKIYVIGIGYKPLDKGAKEIILNSEIILASSRLFEVFKGYEEFEIVKDKIKVIINVDETMNFIRSSLVTRHSSLPIVLLASGDPLFFGIGRRVIREFGKDVVEILPDLSSIQIAFSRIKEPWDDAFLMSLHGGPDPEKRRRLPYEIDDIPSLLHQHNKIAILTDKENNPSAITKVLNSSLVTRYSLLKTYVCEKLGYPDEKVMEGTPEEIADMSFSDPNVVIILSSQNTVPPTPHPLPQGEGEGVEVPFSSTEEDETRNIPSPLTGEGNGVPKKSQIFWGAKGGGESLASETRFGLTENEILHSRGLITKDAVRAVTIHKLRLPQKGVFWDIGAGSGSVSIEVARLYPELTVFAIERDEEQISNIKGNRIKFNAGNIEIIQGEAPDAMIKLPSPDRVFIGGSSGRLKEIIDFIVKTPAKIIVINAATIETLNEAFQSLENNGFEVEVSEVSVSRSKTIAGKRHMSALNPVFVIKGEKP